MSNNHSPLVLRRQALLAECQMQRLMVAAETRALLEPLAPSNLRLPLGPKLPLALAGVVLGLVVLKPARALPLLRMATSLWPLARTAMGMLRPAQQDTDV